MTLTQCEKFAGRTNDSQQPAQLYSVFSDVSPGGMVHERNKRLNSQLSGQSIIQIIWFISSDS